jgi:hypothetical protein
MEKFPKICGEFPLNTPNITLDSHRNLIILKAHLFVVQLCVTECIERRET